MMSSRIIVFTRYPIPGRTKTRLIPTLGAKGAADLQRHLTEQVVETVRQCSQSCGVQVEIRFNGGSATLMSRWLGTNLVYRRQEGRDLGEKMFNSFQQAFAEGSLKVILIGADIPDLTVTILEASLDLLDENDVVLGPANDGGYYLLGLREPTPSIFQNISWGSSRVLAETSQRAYGLGLKLGFVKTLDDVDSPQDILKMGCHDRTIRKD